MAVDMGALCDDLQAETDELDTLLVTLSATDWDLPTPAEGWMIRDEISHLAHFDSVTVQSALDPEAFKIDMAKVIDVDAFTAEVAARYRAMPGSELLAWFRQARASMIDTFRTLDPSLRVPWYGPAMSVPSSLTARIMETWAHGQDVADTVDRQRRPTPALRQVAHLCVRAFPNSFRAQGRPVPDTEVRVELTGPDGDLWTWGAEGAADTVRGSALEFCLVATQRRHPEDTDLVTTGPVAAEWIAIAQAFAGPPGRGRRPGQFPRR